MESNSPMAVVNFFDEQLSREIVTIQTAVQLVVGKRYKISMNFISTLNDELRGFYRSSYVDGGERKWATSFKKNKLTLLYIMNVNKLLLFSLKVVSRNSIWVDWRSTSISVFRRAKYESQFHSDSG